MRDHSAMLLFFGKWLLPLVLPMALLSAWHFGVKNGSLPQTLIASPAQALKAGVTLISNGKLLHHSWVSGRRLILGFLLGALLAFTLGVAVGLSKVAERFIAPTVGILAPVPVAAWIPLIIILFGIGEMSKISVIALGTFFLLFFNVYQGIRTTDPKLIYVARMYGKTPLQLVILVLLPSASGSILRGIRSAVGLGWVLLIVAEVIASADGLGWLMWDARNFSRPDDLIVGMVTVGTLGLITDWSLSWCQGRILRWQPTFKGQ